jgi:hypothetical protein
MLESLRVNSVCKDYSAFIANHANLNTLLEAYDRCETALATYTHLPHLPIRMRTENVHVQS